MMVYFFKLFIRYFYNNKTYDDKNYPPKDAFKNRVKIFVTKHMQIAYEFLCTKLIF